MVPPLAFNDSKTPTTIGSFTAVESLAGGFRKIIDFSSVNCEPDFQSKVSLIKINRLALSTISTRGIFFETENYNSYCLIIPLIGNIQTSINGVEYKYSIDDKGFFGVWEKQKSICVGSGVGIQFPSDRLSDTRSGMFGSSYQSAFPENPQIKSMTLNGVSFIELFKSLFAQIDAVGGDEIILSKLALDDSFYRLCVGLLYPNLFLKDETHHGKRPYVRPEVDRLCEYVIGHLTDPIPLTEMENRSGLSTRVLQRSFQNAFGLTPKQWVRKQRLHAARAVMLKASEPITITALAYDFCFPSPSDFSYHYLLEFGEQPSQTARRKVPILSPKSFVEFGK